MGWDVESGEWWWWRISQEPKVRILSWMEGATLTWPPIMLAALAGCWGAPEATLLLVDGDDEDEADEREAEAGGRVKASGGAVEINGGAPETVFEGLRFCCLAAGEGPRVEADVGGTNGLMSLLALADDDVDEEDEEDEAGEELFCKLLLIIAVTDEVCTFDTSSGIGGRGH
jgi:hypothetical protein